MKTNQDIKASLDRAAALVSAKPEVGRRAYKCSAVVKDGLACSMVEKDWRFVADLPASMGGDNTGPSPSTLFRAAVSSCVAMGVKMWAARLEATVTHVEVQFDTDVDARGQFGVYDDAPAGFERARLDIHVRSNAQEGVIGKAIEKSMRYSPMLDAIAGRIDIETRITISRTTQAAEGVEA